VSGHNLILPARIWRAGDQGQSRYQPFGWRLRWCQPVARVFRLRPGTGVPARRDGL